MRTEDLGKLILRLTIGGLLLLHGISKVRNGIDWMPAMLTAKNLPEALKWGVYVGELLAPVLVILGLFTRPAAFLILVNMGIATYVAKMDGIASLNKGGGWALELEALYGLGALAICFLGAGKLSLRGGAAKVD
jgi:putative oxidoreductase